MILDASVTSKYTRVEFDADKKEYEIRPVDQYGVVASIRFQDGAVKEAGVNGCFVEDVLAVAIHRLQALDRGLPSHYNEVAVRHLFAAQGALNARTAERLERGVAGTSKK
ncbi:MAG: hypothetical protein LBW85_01235 [Deltaproteobacteria bacterium]|jgi:hypothetical protein|nr:hypothetical protein [Deltaproteobacteria bacterium]